LKLLCWRLTSKNYSSSFHGIYEIISFKYQRFFLEVFLTVNFFTPKLMKIRWSSPFFGVFCTSLSNQVEHTWLISQFHVCNYEWVKILFVDVNLDSKLQHCGPCETSWKKSKTSHVYHSGHIEGDIRTVSKKKVKKSEKPRFYGQNELLS
jgi:hypothetical protein